MLLLVCFPLGLAAEAVVARMLLRTREGYEPSFREVREVVAMEGLANVLFRLIGLTVAWLFLAFFITALLFVVGLVVKAVAFDVAHPGVKPPKLHSWALPFAWISFLIHAALMARYSFVLPLFVTRSVGSEDVLKAGVAMAKRSVLFLGVLTFFEYGLVFAFGHLMRSLESGAVVTTFAVATLSLLVTSAVTCWFALVKADLAFGAVEHGALQGVPEIAVA